MDNDKMNQSSRRSFLKGSLLTGAASTLGFSAVQNIHAAGSDEIKIGIIGCGGRGMGAVNDSFNAMPNTRLVAMGELFADRAENARAALKEHPDFNNRVDVPDSRLFTGFDNYKGVVENADLVLIACASRFHPFYAKTAASAGKHVFVEKPHGIDAKGVRIMKEAGGIAKENGTAFVSGLCYRYDTERQEAIAEIKKGLIGDIVSVQSDYVRYPYSLIERQKEWTEIEYQFRNWYHFTWLAGDEILQSLLHNLDSVLWALDERVPVSAYGIGGRSTEEIPEMGDQYDHSAVIYEYDDGLRIYGMDRAARNCVTSNQDIFHGTKGRCYFRATDSPYITDLQNNKIWEPSEPRKRNMYVQEHYDLINSILENKPINNGERMVTSTMTAILGMIATRSGQRVSYQELYDSNFTFGPDEDQFSLDMEPMFGPNADGCYKVAVPGVTKDY